MYNMYNAIQISGNSLPQWVILLTCSEFEFCSALICMEITNKIQLKVN